LEDRVSYEIRHGQLTAHAEIDLLLLRGCFNSEGEIETCKPRIVFCESKFRHSEIKFHNQFVSLMLSEKYGPLFASDQLEVTFVGYYFEDYQERNNYSIEALHFECNKILDSFEKVDKNDYDKKDTFKRCYVLSTTAEKETTRKFINNRLQKCSKIVYLSFSQIFETVKTLTQLPVMRLTGWNS
jgi:hypothetical protein